MIEMDKEQEKRVKVLHAASLVVDAHSDVHIDIIRRRGRGETHVMEHRLYPQWKEAGINVVVLNTMCRFSPDPYPYYCSPARNMLLILDILEQEIAESPQCFKLILSPRDMLQAKAEGKIGLLLGTEGAEAVDMDIGLLRCYYRLGLRIMNLAWHHRNFAADGVAEPSNAGLSNFGRALLKEMNRLGMLVDVSHLSAAGVRDVLALSDQPVIASHSNAKGICDHQRNLDDWQIKGIAEKGGVIGVTFLGRFVAAKNPSLDDVIRHVDYLVEKAGVEHVALGADYLDGAADLIIQSRRIAGPNQPVNDTDVPFAAGLEKITDMRNFTLALARRGYTDLQIQQILGGNFLRLFQTVANKT